MSEISINPAIPRQTAKLPDDDALAKGLGISEKTAEVVNQALSLLGETGVKIQNTAVRNDTTGTPVGATGAPVLDNPDDKSAKEADLERLIAFLQLANDEKQAEMAQKRIDLLKDSLKSEHEDRAQKIQKSLDDMQAAAESETRNKIFGWIMTGLAIAAAVVACVATGGIAVGAVIAAAIALTCQILDATGAMDTLTDTLSKGLQDLGMDKNTAKIVAQAAIALVILGLTLASGGFGNISSALSDTVRAVVEIVKPIVQTANTVMAIGTTVSTGFGAYQGYQAGLSQADVTETEKFLTIIRKKLEDSEDELQQILDAIQSCVGQLAELLASATNTGNEIAQQIGQMA